MVDEGHPRANQRARTRQAILEGARRLMARGETVTVTAAAEEVGVSKATAYRYFSDPGVLAGEAGLDISVLPYETITAEASDPRQRVLAISLYFYDLTIAHEAAFRQYLARSLDTWSAGTPAVRRGGRRKEMFERALADVPLPAARLRQLVASLCAGTGPEALIALQDVAGVAPDEARAAVQELAEALLDRFLG